MAASWNNDQAFVDAIERRMPTGTMIFQFPPTPFPEAGTLNQMTDYSHLRGYLHDDGTLRWSYGAVKGRPRADWQTVVRNQIGPIGALQPLLGLGFRGYWIDTFGYSPGEGETLVKVVAKAIRTQPIRSRDGRFAFFDLRPFRARLHKSDAQLRVLSRDLLGV
jgi:phosphoglycerol transferase